MKILFSTHLREWGGGELWMLTAARAMAARGHEVTLAAPDASVIATRARDAGIEVLAVEYTRDFDPSSFFRVWRFCVGRGVDVLCLNMDRVLRVGGLAARLAGVPVVMPRRGSEFPLKGHLNYRFNYGVVATGMIVNSQATARTLCQGIPWRPRGNIHVLYNGLDLSPYEDTPPREEIRAELGFEPEGLLLVSVGELTSRKNTRLTVSILPRLIERFGNVSLLVVGEGVERENLIAQAHDLDVDQALLLLGFRDDVPSLLKACDVLVHPAHIEGFGFAVAEGMAAGLPCVATDASSLPEIVVPGVTGALFPDDDADALFEALVPYLADPVLRLTHGEAGRARVHERFELEARMDELAQIFRHELGHD